VGQGWECLDKAWVGFRKAIVMQIQICALKIVNNVIFSRHLYSFAVNW
jgi:hypothetical protein